MIMCFLRLSRCKPVLACGIRYSAVVAAGFVAAVSAAHAEILFIAKVMGPVSNIYSIAASGGEPAKLTDNARWRDMEADISKDGEIVFMSNREKNSKIDLEKQAERFDIYTMDVNGKNLKRVTDTSGHEIIPKFSPDGKWITYIGQANGKHQLNLMKKDGSGARVLAAADNIFDFSWSPGSKKLSYARLDGTDSVLMILDIESGEDETLLKVSTAAAPEDDKSAGLYRVQIVCVQWSPDGDKIAYIKHPFSQGASRQLRVLNLKSGEDKLISSEKSQVQNPVVWSKDSQRLLYSALVGYKFYYDEKIHKKVYEGGMHIFIASLDGKNQQITEGDFLFKHPVFSPDEKRIAFLYADTLSARTLSLRTMKADGTDIQELYGSVAKRSSLHWF